mmetsp:Transcript_57797/g.163066  ORF Transcript_57797/g.163066 Transcript_57797/m.163066 type:complete len:354 (-) Transcript_57797:978-2039(-)
MLSSDTVSTLSPDANTAHALMPPPCPSSSASTFPGLTPPHDMTTDVPSRDVVTTAFPLGNAAQDVTQPGCCLTPTACPVPGSHRTLVLSSDAVRTALSDRTTAQAQTGLTCERSTMSGLPTSTPSLVQIMPVLSRETVNTRSSARKTAQDRIQSVCPRSTLSLLPSLDQMMPFQSRDTVRTRRPRGNMATAVMRSVCPWNVATTSPALEKTTASSLTSPRASGSRVANTRSAEGKTSQDLTSAITASMSPNNDQIMHTASSADAVTTFSSEGRTAQDVMPFKCPTSAVSCEPSLDQMMPVLSWDPVRTRVPDGKTAQHLIGLVCPLSLTREGISEVDRWYGFCDEAFSVEAAS